MSALAQVLAFRTWDALRRRHGSTADVTRQAWELVELLTVDAEQAEP